jgi:hypothetical protein
MPDESETEVFGIFQSISGGGGWLFWLVEICGLLEQV